MISLVWFTTEVEEMNTILAIKLPKFVEPYYKLYSYNHKSKLCKQNDELKKE